jgi:hypothetical protein
MFRPTLLAAAALLIGPGGSLLHAQLSQPVCNRGKGHFDGILPTGMTVRVGAVTSGAFATRACQAVLSSKGDRVEVVRTSPQIDIDVLGADLGFGSPVAAFTVQPVTGRPSYEIWSIERKPRRLRILTGGGSYRALDAGFHQQVAIWTTDAAAVDGFDGLADADYRAPPTVVLQFDHNTLVDVSAWYREQYDHQIAALRRTLTAKALIEFRKTDGQLSAGSLPTAELVPLRKTKAAALEIVWAYLYSGRPDRAWAELAALWPAADLDRIKAAIAAARARGNRGTSDQNSLRRAPPEVDQRSSGLRIPEAGWCAGPGQWPTHVWCPRCSRSRRGSRKGRHLVVDQHARSRYAAPADLTLAATSFSRRASSGFPAGDALPHHRRGGESRIGHHVLPRKRFGIIGSSQGVEVHPGVPRWQASSLQAKVRRAANSLKQHRTLNRARLIQLPAI